MLHIKFTVKLVAETFTQRLSSEPLWQRGLEGGRREEGGEPRLVIVWEPSPALYAYNEIRWGVSSFYFIQPDSDTAIGWDYTATSTYNVLYNILFHGLGLDITEICSQQIWNDTTDLAGRYFSIWVGDEEDGAYLCLSECFESERANIVSNWSCVPH